MKYDFLTIGGATRDITFFTKDGLLMKNPDDLLRQELLAFEQGAKIKVDKFHYLFGGGAANAAVNFAKSGFSVACFLRVGKDEAGLAILYNLKKQGVKVAFIQKDENLATGFSFILVNKNGERIIFSNRSANEKLKLNKATLGAASRANWLYFASLPKNWQSIARPFFSLNKAKIAWNPGTSQYGGGLKSISWFLKRTNVFMLNHDEAIELVLSDDKYKGKSKAFYNKAKNLLPIIKNYGPEVVVITKGKKGADAFDGKNYYHQEVYKETKRVDTTGIGDAFNSSFTAAYYLTKGNIQKSLKIAAKNAAYKISSLGAQNGLHDISKLI
jgi:sugar/nucleoside kinase (ribokinase family)